MATGDVSTDKINGVRDIYIETRRKKPYGYVFVARGGVLFARA